VRISALDLAFVAIFAALYYVLSILSLYVPAIGLPEITISLTAFIASVYGILLGPGFGALTAFVGAVVAWVLPPGGGSLFGLPFLLSPPLNAASVGLIYNKRWMEAFGLLGLLIFVFWFTLPVTPLSQYAYIGVAVTWDKIIALALIPPVAFLLRRASSAKALFATFFLLAFVGNQADNMWGALVFAFPVVYTGIFGLNVETVRFLFVLSPFAYPAIRIIQAFLAAVVAVPLVKALKSAGWMPLAGRTKNQEKRG